MKECSMCKFTKSNVKFHKVKPTDELCRDCKRFLKTCTQEQYLKKCKVPREVTAVTYKNCDKGPVRVLHPTDEPILLVKINKKVKHVIPFFNRDSNVLH